MSKAEQAPKFHFIADAMVATQDGVDRGRMMSHPAIAFRGKVFAFLGSRGDMVLRLGAGSDPTELGVAKFELLAPFKTKPPMKDWFRIDSTDSEHWQELADRALARMRNASR